MVSGSKAGNCYLLDWLWHQYYFTKDLTSIESDRNSEYDIMMQSLQLLIAIGKEKGEKNDKC